MKRIFIVTPIFKQLLDQLDNPGLELIIKDEILKEPLKGKIITGTGGIRKLRVGDKKEGRGKSGSFRILYFDLPDKNVTYLVLIYKKSEIENITAAEKKQLKQLIEVLKDEN